MSPKRAFADAIIASEILPRLLYILSSCDTSIEQSDITKDLDVNEKDDSLNTKEKLQDRSWSIMEKLCSSPSLASMVLSSSAWLELLGIIAGYAPFTKSYTARKGAAKTLARLFSDPEGNARIGKCD